MVSTLSRKSTELILRPRLRLAQDDRRSRENLKEKSVILSLSKDQFRAQAQGASKISKEPRRQVVTLSRKSAELILRPRLRLAQDDRC